MRRASWCIGAVLLACGGDDDGAAGSTGSDTGGGTTPSTMTTPVTMDDDSADDDVADEFPQPSSSDPSATDPSSGADSTSAPGSSSDDGAQPGDCSAALLCDDFEDDPAGAPPADPWVVSVQGASLAVDDTVAYSGTHSIRIVTDDGGETYRRAYMSIEGAPVFPIASNVVWGRMMYNLVETPAGSVHWTNIQGEGDVEDMDFRGVYRYGGQHDGRLMANYETFGAGSDCWDHSDTVMPTGVWACIEWRFDGPNDTMEFWLDGVQQDDMTVVGMGEGCINHETGDYWYAPIFDTMRLGWEHYQNTSSREMWIDDVAMDDERIGCPE
jgi:hypothetical protein